MYYVYFGKYVYVWELSGGRVEGGGEVSCWVWGDNFKVSMPHEADILLSHSPNTGICKLTVR